VNTTRLYDAVSVCLPLFVSVSLSLSLWGGVVIGVYANRFSIPMVDTATPERSSTEKNQEACSRSRQAEFAGRAGVPRSSRFFLFFSSVQMREALLVSLIS
jgi:hypothetical protein